MPDLPVAGQLRQAEADRHHRDEDAVKDRQHRQHPPECHLGKQ